MEAFSTPLDACRAYLEANPGLDPALTSIEVHSRKTGWVAVGHKVIDLAPGLQASKCCCGEGKCDWDPMAYLGIDPAEVSEVNMVVPLQPE